MIQDRLDEARKYGLEKNYEMAFQIIDEVITDYPDYPPSYVLRASYMSILPNQRLDAINYLNKAIVIDPEYTTAYHLRGEIKSGLEGLNDLNTAIELDSFDAGIFYSRGQLKNGLHNYYGALDDFNKALELDNLRSIEIKSTLFGDIALSKIQLFEYSEALDDVNKAIQLNPSNPTNFYIRYIYYSKTGELELAMKDLNYAKMLGLQDYGDILGMDSIPTFNYQNQ
ncbi:hypothetical protein [Algoriphagus aquimarinus]|uniref:tetratricopeptide repeat protein n=1 Tax=Algoriphagus aquimarinus TaxID=237018 RepID=UPI0030DD4B2E